VSGAGVDFVSQVCTCATMLLLIVGRYYCVTVCFSSVFLPSFVNNSQLVQKLVWVGHIHRQRGDLIGVHFSFFRKEMGLKGRNNAIKFDCL
jgi:hypothetical protein